MRFALPLLILAISACSDPSLQISFDVPEPYRDNVDSVALQIIVPPAAGMFTCGQLAFQEVSAETVEVNTVQSVVVDADASLPLSGIPREGQKLIYLRGLDSEGLAVVAACVEVGTVDDATTITAVGEPTTILTFNPVAAGAPLRNLPVHVQDTIGDLADVEVRWRVVGPKGITKNGDTTTDANGDALVTPESPTMAGPAIMDIRARWSRITPPSVSAWVPPRMLANVTLPFTPATTTLTGDNLYRVGRIGPGGETGLVALSVGGSPLTERQAVISYFDAGAGVMTTRNTATIPNAAALGMVTRDGRDRVFTITNDGWIDIEPNGQLTTSPSPVPGKIAQNIVSASCNANGNVDRVLVHFTDNTFVTVDANRNLVTSPFDDESTVRIHKAGCMSDVDGAEYPVVVYGRSGPLPPMQTELYLLAEMDEPRRADIIALRSGLGFAPALGSSPSYMLAAQFDVGGSSVARYQLAEGGEAGTATMVIVTEDQTATPPQSSAGGDVDGDNIADVVGVLSFGEDPQGTPQYRLFVSLGVEHNGERLAGLSPLGAAQRPNLWLADFDGDFVDDLLVGTPGGFVVFHMGETP